MGVQEEGRYQDACANTGCKGHISAAETVDEGSLQGHGHNGPEPGAEQGVSNGPVIDMKLPLDVWKVGQPLPTSIPNTRNTADIANREFLGVST